jgi:pyrroloquinoline quinone biosynthesis protein B
MTRTLHPSDGVRSTPIEAIVLTGAEIDQTAGLLSLRERQPFALYGTETTLAYVAENPMFDALAPATVPRQTVALDEPFELAGGIEARLFAVPGKAPLYAEGDAPLIGSETAANVGVELVREGARFVFVPGCADIGPALRERLAKADAFMFDGTLYSDDELIASGTGEKTGLRMGHVSVAGPEGSLARLAGLENRRIYIHINNTNPILISGSAEHRQVVEAGWEIAFDGMEVAL